MSKLKDGDEKKRRFPVNSTLPLDLVLLLDKEARKRKMNRSQLVELSVRKELKLS